MQWGNQWTGLPAPPVDLLHKPCGHRVAVRVVCSECGEDIRLRDTEPVVGRGLMMAEPAMRPRASAKGSAGRASRRSEG
jgi:hypothetical protein